MKFLHATWQRISNAWLVAAPLVIVALLVAAFVLLGIVQAFVGWIAGPDAADNFIAIAMMLLGMAFVAMLVALPAYGVFCVARWLLKKRELRKRES